MFKTEFDNVYISSFFMEMYLIVKSGIHTDSGLEMLAEDAQGELDKKFLQSLKKKLDEGNQLSEALALTPGFPEYAVRMVKIGEETGKLEEVLKALSDYYERQERTYQSIKNAVAYPSILVAMMLFVVVVVITKVLPVFNNIFAQLGATMNTFAATIMQAGIVINNNIVAFVFVLIGVAAIVLYFFVTEGGQRKISALFFNGKIGEHISVAHFASAMNMAMRSGLDVEDSINMAGELCSENKIVSQKVVVCKQLMAEGEPFHMAISKAKLFPTLYSQMLQVGFKTGASDTVMEEISRRTQEEVSDKIESLVGKIEPTLVIIMSVIVGVILISVMLPLMGILSTIG